MDRLSALIGNFKIKTSVFSQGTLCGEHAFEIFENLGHIHIIKKAPLEVVLQKESILIDEPSLIFFPRPTPHTFRSTDPNGADMICGTVAIGNGLNNPLILGLPECLVLPISKVAEFDKLLDLLYFEAFENRCGKANALNHLMDYLVIRMYRYAIQENLIQNSAISGLADPKISKAVNAIHENPNQQWSLESLADEANMSRSRFAEYFKKKVGISPMNYLSEWRINLATKYLMDGVPIKKLHSSLGYSSPTSFARTFQQRMGMTPKEWLSKSIAQPKSAGS
jgi:AraC-like DNA-binding protein